MGCNETEIEYVRLQAQKELNVRGGNENLYRTGNLEVFDAKDNDSDTSRRVEIQQFRPAAQTVPAMDKYTLLEMFAVVED